MVTHPNMVTPLHTRSRWCRIVTNSALKALSIALLISGCSALNANAWLERAFEARTVWMTFLHLELRLRRLRGTQSFEELLKRIGIAPARASFEGSH